MALSKDDLLKPRYKVIADWPFMQFFKVGDIVLLSFKLQEEWHYHLEDTHQNYGESFFASYPHLFQKLEWWQERDDLAGMYIRAGEKENVHSYYKLIEKFDHPHAELWRMEGRLGEHVYPLNGVFPATQEEYLEFINKNQTTNG